MINKCRAVHGMRNDRRNINTQRKGFQCYCVLNRSHMIWAGIKPGVLQWKSSPAMKPDIISPFAPLGCAYWQGNHNPSWCIHMLQSYWIILVLRSTWCKAELELKIIIGVSVPSSASPRTQRVLKKCQVATVQVLSLQTTALVIIRQSISCYG